MLVGYRNNTKLTDHKTRNVRHAAAATVIPARRSSTRCCLNFSPDAEGSNARIKEMFGRKIVLSVSAYDTAWVAMVPSKDSSNKPCFPQCLDWIMENQHQDGSWGLLRRHPLLLKDYLSCTMACVLALTKWRVGEQLVERGLKFIGSHGSAATKEDQLTPRGFAILFPSMMSEAIKLGLNMPFDQVLIDHMMNNRISVIERIKGKVSVLAYLAEGLEGAYIWEEVRNQQRRNGSFSNSPAATAAALIRHHDDKCFKYLSSVLEEYKNGVPTVYPVDIYVRLCLVDALQRFGVERYHMSEVENVLNYTYRCWELKSEEIFLDVTCCAMAFRLLRMNGYNVSSDELEKFTDQEQFFDTMSMKFTSLISILELYKVSHLMLHQNEGTLEKINAWTSSYLKQQLLDKRILDDRLHKEVEFALRNTYGKLERVQTRHNIDLFSEDYFHLLKTSYRCPSFVNTDFLAFSIHDFNNCQALHKRELQQLDRWYKENRLDQLKNARQVLYSSYFLIAADVFNPELSEARTSYAKSIILVTLADDLFDNLASREELQNIIDLVKKWDENSASKYYSDQVDIFFSALHKTINDLAAKAFVKQGRCIKKNLTRLWLEILEAMMRELDWTKDEATPSMDEYLSVGCVTIASSVCILPAIHFLGLKLPEDVTLSEEYNTLLKHVSIIPRLLNDIRTYKRELLEGKPNCVSLQLVQGQGEITEEEAMQKMKEMIESSRRELQQMVLQTKGSQVPKVCRDLFWTTSKIAYFCYSCRDEFSSPKEIINHINTIIHEPINLPRNTE